MTDIFLIAASMLLHMGAAAVPLSDPTLARKIESLLQTVLTDEAGHKDEIAKAEVRHMFEARGLPTVAEVGNDAAYDFVLLASLGQPLAFQAKVESTIRKASKLKKIPPDAAIFYHARYRLEKDKEQAEKSGPTNPGLRDEIERLYKVDQAVRQRAGFNAKKMRETDEQNAAPLQTILGKYGVPTYATVGVQAAKDFVIMAQHQSAKFRQEVLPKLRANVDKGQADPDSYALVYDRAQRDNAKKQLYGTQLECKPGETMHEAPIEDEDHVNQRRAELGLMRVELYASLIREMMPQFCPPVTPKK